MKKAFYYLLASTLFLTACDEIDMEKGTSSCIRQKTINLQRTSFCEDGGASVKEYQFQGQLVYVFNIGGCIADGNAEVADENCKTLGYLGGLVGNTKINGEDFGNAEYKRTIWEQ